jgi:peptide/nickel transport system substrate-binding protein/nickel transport system substrate-binding protein
MQSCCRLFVKYIPEASSRLQALQTGEVDLIYGADLLSYDDYNQAISFCKVHPQNY